MTRDEVLEQVAGDLEVGGVDCDSQCAAAVRNMKSKPPEKSPEVAPTLGEMLKERAELLARLDGVEAERDHYREALALKRWTEDGAPMKGETP